MAVLGMSLLFMTACTTPVGAAPLSAETVPVRVTGKPSIAGFGSLATPMMLVLGRVSGSSARESRTRILGCPVRRLCRPWKGGASDGRPGGTPLVTGTAPTGVLPLPRHCCSGCCCCQCAVGVLREQAAVGLRTPSPAALGCSSACNHPHPVYYNLLVHSRTVHSMFWCPDLKRKPYVER